MKMKFPDGVTHHYDETGARHELTADSTLEVPDARVPEYLAVGYTKAEDTPVQGVVDEPKAQEPDLAEEKAKALEAAQAVVDAAQSALNAAAAAGEDTEQAKQALAEAQEALAALAQ